ncbi:UbiA prenyltransferase family [Gautieria morchelliformis]|nr:UbiA prenyltransferase family [Gautieria morchelliformis]
MNAPFFTLILGSLSSLLSAVLTHGWTLILFTYTDFKTIFFPVTMFGAVCAPVFSVKCLMQGMVWVWLHLLQCNLSNQYKTSAEDLVNRPWRPIPSGRVSQQGAMVLRWVSCGASLALSIKYGWGVVTSSAALSLTTVIYDELQLSGHWLGKNICAVSGYLTFEVGVTQVMGNNSSLDRIAFQAVIFSASIILTTIHAQDFPDVEGDRVQGRVTLPIYAPNGSRILTFIALIAWSIHLGWIWGIGWLWHLFLSALGGYVGWRYYHFRAAVEDGASYRIYNVWLVLVHLLPVHARWDLLSW